VAKPNLLEGLSRNSVTSSPPTLAVSPTTEVPPSSPGTTPTGPHANRRDFFASVANALAGLDVPLDGSRPQFRRKLTQPPSRAQSPPLLVEELQKPVNYGPGAAPPRAQKRRATVNDKIFADAKWTVEKQQFGVNGGLINAVRSAAKSGALMDYKWVGTLGMVTSSTRLGRGPSFDFVV